MVRKLVLVGVLVLVGRGSVFQLFVAAIVSCISLVLQVHLAPCECGHNLALACVGSVIFQPLTPCRRRVPCAQTSTERTMCSKRWLRCTSSWWC